MTSLPRSTHDPVANLIAVLIGISVPSLIFGRTAIAIVSGLAVVLFFFVADKHLHWSAARAELARPAGMIVAATLLLWLPNVAFSSDPMRSLEAVARTAVFIVMGVIFWSIIQSDTRLAQRAHAAFIVASAFAVVVAVLSLTAVPQIYWVTHMHGWRSDPIATELKSFAALSVFTIPLSLAAAGRRTGMWRGLGWLSAGGFLLLVVMTDNRAAIAGLLGAVAVAAVVYAPRTAQKRRLIVTGVSMIALFGAIALWLFFERAYLKEIAPDRNWLLPVWLIDFERQLIWAHTFKLAMTSPLFGLGVNTVNYAPGAATVIPGTDNLHLIPSHPHNWFMEILAETGVLGLSALIAAIVSLFYRLYFASRNTADAGHLAAIAITAGYWVSGLFNFSFWSAWWQVSFILALAVCTSRHDGSGSSRTLPSG